MSNFFTTRVKIYLTILTLCGSIGFTSYYVGANAGYRLGYKTGAADFVLYGIIIGKVKCEYIE